MTELERLVAAVKKAEDYDRKAAQAQGLRDRALDELLAELGWGDRLAVIRNAQRRIGELMTR